MRYQASFLLLAIAGLCGVAGTSHAQAAGAACSAGQVSGPNASGNNMICSGGVFVETGSSGSLYTLQTFAPTTVTPADATVYYIGSFGIGSVNTYQRMYIPTTGTVTKAYVNFRNTGTTGTGETSTIALRKNDSTDTTISSAVTTNSAFTVVSNTSLNISVSSGDYVEFKWTTPTWATNPGTIAITGLLFIQ
jgi:hypothetical protein